MASLSKVAEILLREDNIEILTHHYPDGDTLGSAYALCLMLQSLGKKAKVLTSGTPARKYEFLKKGVEIQNFERKFVVSVDVAAPSLLGENQQEYENIIDLCIDHHGTNSICAKESYVDANAAADISLALSLRRSLNRGNVRVCMPIAITQSLPNCNLSKYYISVDVGSRANTVEEAMAAGERLAFAFSDVLIK